MVWRFRAAPGVCSTREAIDGAENVILINATIIMLAIIVQLFADGGAAQA